MPIDIETLRNMIQTAIPDAEIQLEDLRGDQDHYSAHVVSPSFKGKSRIQQHRIVHEALKDILGTTLHALALQTSPPSE